QISLPRPRGATGSGRRLDSPRPLCERPGSSHGNRRAGYPAAPLSDRRQRVRLPRLPRPPEPGDVARAADERRLRLHQHGGQAPARGAAAAPGGGIRPAGRDLPRSALRRLQGHARAHARRAPPADGLRAEGRRGAPPAGGRGARRRGRRRDRHGPPTGVAGGPRGRARGGRGPVEEILAHLDAVEQSGVRGAKKLRETLAREAETARLSKELATIRCDLPVALDLERLRWEGPDAEKLRPLFAELEFTSLLRDLVPSGAAPEVAHATPRTPEEMRAALGALAAAGAVGVVPVGARLEGLALAGPSGPVVVIAEVDAPGALAALAPLMGDLATAKLGADLKALRVALARRGVALAGPGLPRALASYCLNPSRAEHGIGALAEELLGVGRDDGAEPALAAARAARATHALRPLLAERLRTHAMERLFYELEMPLAE